MPIDKHCNGMEQRNEKYGRTHTIRCDASPMFAWNNTQCVKCSICHSASTQTHKLLISFKCCVHCAYFIGDCTEQTHTYRQKWKSWQLVVGGGGRRRDGNEKMEKTTNKHTNLIKVLYVHYIIAVVLRRSKWRIRGHSHSCRCFWHRTHAIHSDLKHCSAANK